MAEQTIHIATLEADVARLTEDIDHYEAAVDKADSIITEMDERYHQAADEIVRLRGNNATLTAELEQATALLRRLVFIAGPCRHWSVDGAKRGECHRHNQQPPCPVGEARVWLEQREGK